MIRFGQEPIMRSPVSGGGVTTFCLSYLIPGQC
jgi:hypothetical protein